MSTSSSLLNSPLSLYSLPIVWYTAFFPMNLKFVTIADTIGWDNVQPRGNTQRVLHEATVPKDVSARIARMEGAHLNGNETFPVWAAAILAGNLVGLPHRTLNLASAVFISLRVLYNAIYINQTTERASWTRTGVFFTGLGIPLWLMVKGANKARLLGAQSTRS